MFKKIALLAGLSIGSIFFSSQVYADVVGPCTPDSTHIFNAVMDKTITDTSQNSAGTTFPDFWSWDLGGSYQLTCSCPDPNVDTTIYFKAATSLLSGHSDSNNQYYIVNDNIQISTAVWIEGGLKKYVAVPFTDVSNENNSKKECTSSGNATTGTKGKLSLYINHPFVGKLDIPSTKIFDMYATKVSGVYNSVPLASVYFSGQILVPQGCELATGSTLEIPFGEFQAHDFKDRKGQQPAGSSPITKTLEFKCTNIADGIKIYLRMEGTPNASDSNAIDLGNPDIGAVTENSTGQIMIPNDSQGQQLNVSALTDATNRTASTELKFYPISTTGKMPAVGDFEGIATLRIDVE